MSTTDPALPPLRLPRVRDEAVLLDSDLAALYGVETKAFNKAIKRNARRFPADFAFQLTPEEFAALRFQLGTSNGRGGRRFLPWASTEHGAIMAAMILNSERAVAMSTYVVRAFMRLRRELLTSATLELRLTKIEKELLSHDAALRGLHAKSSRCCCRPRQHPRKKWAFTRGSGNRSSRARFNFS